MKISVITVCKNMARELEQTINSLKIQSFTDFEYIVVDGKSTDNTIEVIKKNQKFIGKYLIESDTGIYNAMNKGINMANGEYVYFLNAGDTLVNESVLKNVSLKLADYDLVYGDINIVEGDLVYRNSFEHVTNWFLTKNSICHQSLFSKRELFLKWGGFDDSFQIAGDYEWLLRMWYKVKVSRLYLPIVVANFNMGGKSSSQKYVKLRDLESNSVRLAYFNIWYRYAIKF
jgi:glycosyltransferase involved in cell wall biosynthesis